jgi:phosphopantetheinyl transferase (holo-ACP synthase)
MEQKINTPFPFGFGIDIISAKKVSLKTLKTSFIRRILSAEEIKIYLSMKTSHEKIAFLKGR